MVIPGSAHICSIKTSTLRQTINFLIWLKIQCCLNVGIRTWWLTFILNVTENFLFYRTDRMYFWINTHPNLIEWNLWNDFIVNNYFFFFDSIKLYLVEYHETDGRPGPIVSFIPVTLTDNSKCNEIFPILDQKTFFERYIHFPHLLFTNIIFSHTHCIIHCGLTIRK